MRGHVYIFSFLLKQKSRVATPLTEESSKTNAAGKVVEPNRGKEENVVLNSSSHDQISDQNCEARNVAVDTNASPLQAKHAELSQAEDLLLNIR